MQIMEVAGLDHDEQLLWGVLARLETLALTKYEKDAPELAIPEKQQVVHTLQEGAPDASTLDDSALGEPVRELLDAAATPGETDTLIVQGFLLERLGQIIYKVLGKDPAVSAATRKVASAGWNACSSVIRLAT